MKSPFVPLSASTLPKVQKTFVPKVLPSVDSSPSPAATAVAPHSHSGQPGPPKEPSIELKREGERVVGITVRCGCGDVIEIECVP